MNREKIKILGFYVLVMLVIARFVVVPLDNSVKEKKYLLNSYSGTYMTKATLVKRHAGDQRPKEISGKQEDLLKSIYQKDFAYTLIQSEMFKGINDMIEKHGLAVINFELPEPAVAKDISEVPVLLRFQGSSKAVIDLLKSIEKWKKTLSVKTFEITGSGQGYACTMSVVSFRIEK